MAIGVRGDIRNGQYYVSGGASVARLMQGIDALRHGLHIVALVGVTRERHGLAAQGQVTQPGGEGQDVHLAAGVIHVVLALHLIARHLEHVAQTGAEGRPTPMAYVEWAGGVGGNELDLHLLAQTLIAAAIGRALLQDPRRDALPGHRFEKQVDEAGAGDFRLFQQGGGRQRGDDRLRQFARVAFQHPAQLHRHVAGEIAVTGLLGSIQFDQGLCVRGDLAQGLFDQREEMGFGFEMGSHGRMRLESRGIIAAEARQAACSKRPGGNPRSGRRRWASPVVDVRPAVRAPALEN